MAATPDSEHPKWNGSNDNSLEAILEVIKERFAHDDRRVDQYETALRGGMLRIPRAILAEVAVISARLSGHGNEAIKSARTCTWASGWHFPELLDWMEGGGEIDTPERRDELLAAIGGIGRLICGEGFTYEGRQYTVVYAHIEQIGDESHIHGFAACPSIYIA